MNIIQLKNKQATLDVCEYGAHIISWKSQSGNERIFTSKQAIFEKPQAIRGGVPIIFPQFNERGPVQRHGFARNMDWTVLSKQENKIVLELKNNPQTKLLWPYSFRAIYQITLNENDVSFSLTIKNTDNTPFYFTCALHSYFKINQLSHCALEGLKDLNYWDNGSGDFDFRKKQIEDELTFSDAIDRVYFNLQSPLIFNNAMETLEITHRGFSDCVVWNPGKNDAKNMKDFADEEFNEMLCIEAAQIDQPIELMPTQSWEGTQTIKEL